MLRINHGISRPFCDGVSRRRFLEVGSLGAFGLSLSSLLRGEVHGADAAGRPLRRSSKRSVILIWQHGGPSQLDTFDMKPLAPSEIRGHGQIIGSTDAKAAFPESRPVGVEDFCAIVYHSLGLQPNDTIIDHSGRPMHLLPGGTVPRELL